VHGTVPAARWHQKPHTKIWNGRRFGNAVAPKIDDMSIVHGNKAWHLGLIVQDNAAAVDLPSQSVG
jgi:hypothetical protein